MMRCGPAAAALLTFFVCIHPRSLPGAELSGPKPMPYGPGYYAAYFADPSGNPLEVYVRPG